MKKSDERQALQQMIDESFESLKPHSPESPRYIAITNAFAWMIATDIQPFSVVEDEGFKIYKYHGSAIQATQSQILPDKIIPGMYEETREKVKTCVNSPMFLVLTTDCWMSPVDLYLTHKDSCQLGLVCNYNICS